MGNILLILAFIAVYSLGVVTPKGLSKLAEWYINKTSVKAVAQVTPTTKSETNKTK